MGARKYYKIIPHCSLSRLSVGLPRLTPGGGSRAKADACHDLTKLLHSFVGLLYERFYRYLLGLRKDNQITVIENEHPPDFVSRGGNVIVFTKNPRLGRYGFFPTA
jgi:hypothetical protein